MSDKLELRFKKQQFQVEAAAAVVNVFEGQPFLTATFKADQGKNRQYALPEEGFGNHRLRLSTEELKANIIKVQRKNMIKPLETMPSPCQLTVEMETGTGKTYTYIKTMYELNRLYGWSKFIVVVPSIAIREGVAKSFSIMQNHFREEYGKTIRSFIYNSKNLNEIDVFASNKDIHAMIINSQAFNAKGKDARRIYMELDDFASRRPIDVLAKTNPILIIDEPQSVEGKKTAENLKNFNPLFILRYSATPKTETKPYTVYRLDAMDAYNKKLVKKIYVKGFTLNGNPATEGYVYLQSINLSKAHAPTATIEFDFKGTTGIRKLTKTVSDKEEFNLFDQSNGLEEYKDGWIVSEINGFTDTVSFVNGRTIEVGEVIGKIAEDQERRLQIRETILTHLKREQQLYTKGIKVLSLFFIDEVAKYRLYDDDGNPVNGSYATMFEEEYKNAVESYNDLLTPEYRAYLNKIPAESTHSGYFSIDKKKHFIDSDKNKEGISEDQSAYDLIMKDKETLLNLKNNVRFIFSHSALREGWDNPNVFQICTLKKSVAGDRKRQEIGRGMRLCVNQVGERMDEDVVGKEVHEINRLTVIANESYESFAKSLQEEIADVLSDRPQKVDKALFVGKMISLSENTEKEISDDLAQEIVEALISGGYVKKGQLTDKFYHDKEADALDLEDLNDIKTNVVKILDTLYDGNKNKPENDRKNNVSLQLDREKYARKEFQALWKKINQKTYYTVSFDTDELVRNCINALDTRLTVNRITYKIEEGAMKDIKSKEALLSGTAFRKSESDETKVENIAVGSSMPYDLVGKIVDGTGLTRSATVSILTGIKPVTFSLFKDNPEDFILKTCALINEERATAIIKRIVYNKLDDVYEGDAIFAEPEIKGCLGKNAVEVKKHLYDYLIYDSDGERKFAEALDASNKVAVYVKLPGKFYINTPVGNYNPDWAVAFNEGAVKHIFFVAETKGSLRKMDLRLVENSKIECAKKHFQILNDGEYVYDVVASFDDLMNKVMK